MSDQNKKNEIMGVTRVDFIFRCLGVRALFSLLLSFHFGLCVDAIDCERVRT